MTSTHDDSADRRAILAADRELLDGLVRRDVGALERLLSPDFVAVHITGQEQSRADWLAQVSSGAMAYHHVERESSELRVAEGSAVLVTRNLVTATIWRTRATWPLESTTRYAHRVGRWTVLRSAATTY
ncbi:nuclear transport factor 2 family protein [Cellulosimicrobium sp. Marseille-Q8652]